MFQGNNYYHTYLPEELIKPESPFLHKGIRKVNKKMSGRVTGEAGEYFREWLGGLDPDTMSQYLRYFERFLEWLGTDAQELYERHRDNLASGEPIRRMWLGKKVTEHQRHMRDELGYSVEDEDGKPVATGSVLVIQKAVAGFLESVGIKGLPGRGRIKVRIEEIPGISRDQLNAVLNATGSYKNRAYILFGKDAGLRTGDITNIPLGARGDALTKGMELREGTALREAIDDPDVEYFTFEWKQQKTGRIANPAIGPEAFGGLREWARYRAERLGLPAGDGDPLFCIEKTREGHTTKRGIEVKGTRAGGRMDESNMSVVFNQLVRKAGLEAAGISIHSLRKFHKTNLEAGGCPESWVNRMQGRKGIGTGGTYSKPDSRQLLTMYMNTYPELTIAERPRLAKEAALEALRAVARTYGIDPLKLRIERLSEGAAAEDEMRLLEGEIRSMRGEEGPRLRRLGERQRGTEQRVVAEGELQRYLDEGWRFAAALNNGSGKVIVERET